jgi:hypothetical protein
MQLCSPVLDAPRNSVDEVYVTQSSKSQQTDTLTPELPES